jgi:uncharacterized protein YqjF (DUF2071 family)
MARSESRRDAMTRRAFLTAEWRWLVMLNFAIDPAHLTPFLPRGTTLDLWQDRAMVSIVGFQFLNSAIAGLPLPFHQRFEEVNLRFYVRREAAGEVRRGVTFIRELVPRTVVALAARVAYNEPYTAVKMRSVVPPAIASEGRVEYAWKVRASWQHIAAEFHGEAELPAADSEGSFIAEHYWGYGKARDGSTLEYEVSHPPWRIWTASNAEFTGDVAGLYGASFVEALAAPPVSSFVAEGSPVTVYRAERLQEAP